MILSLSYRLGEGPRGKEKSRSRPKGWWLGPGNLVGASYYGGRAKTGEMKRLFSRPLQSKVRMGGVVIRQAGSLPGSASLISGISMGFLPGGSACRTPNEPSCCCCRQRPCLTISVRGSETYLEPKEKGGRWWPPVSRGSGKTESSRRPCYTKRPRTGQTVPVHCPSAGVGNRDEDLEAL